MSGIPHTITPIDDGLNAIQFQSLSYNPSNPTGDLYAATDFGVLRLPSGASHWESAGTSLPSVAVYGLTLSQSAHVLYAATHGRGAYALSLPTS